MNLTGDSKQDDVVDGMTGELSTALARLDGPRVISPLSAMKYKDTKKSLAQIARELRIDGIVKGSVTRVGGKVQVKARLINASTTKDLWADSFEREAPDVAALQSDVAKAIAQQVGIAPARRIVPASEPRTRSPRRPTRNTSAAVITGTSASSNRRSSIFRRRSI